MLKVIAINSIIIKNFEAVSELAQGKLHGCPFHVESKQYKYAVEHEYAGYNIRSNAVSCSFYDKKTKKCNLWNSGFRCCRSYKCRYLVYNISRNAKCETCAFCFENECYFPQKSLNIKIEGNEARYCRYYMKKSDNPQLYEYLQKCCERILYTRDVALCEEKIATINRWIRKAECKLQSRKLTKDKKMYIRERIDSKGLERMKLEKHLSMCRQRLALLGGKLETIPQKKKK